MLSSYHPSIAELVEKLSSPGSGQEYAQTYGMVFTAAVALYLPLVLTVARAVREERLQVPAGPLKFATFLYNTLAGLLSGYGFWLMWSDPSLLGPTTLFIRETEMLPNTRLVVNLFCLTKCFEFVDTFLHSALKGKDPTFLHAFHHIATSIVSWYAVASGCDFQHYPVFMNLLVHAVMFAYFSVVAIHPAVKRALRVFRLPITGIQLIQMFLGTYNQWLVVTKIGEGCADADAEETGGCFRHDRAEWQAAYGGLGMYALYIAIFGKFFLDQYVFAKEVAGPGPAGRKKKEK